MATDADGIGVPEKSLKCEGIFLGGPSGEGMALLYTPKGLYEFYVVA